MTTVMERYEIFVENMADENSGQIRVFEPLNQRQVNELLLIREVSRTLQQKKDDEINKTAQAAKEAVEDKQKEEKEEEVKEENEKEDS